MLYALTIVWAMVAPTFGEGFPTPAKFELQLNAEFATVSDCQTVLKKALEQPLLDGATYKVINACEVKK